jgi:hypothetical protein
VETKHVYLDDKAIEHADAIIETGVVASVSAAIRFSLAQVAAAIPRTSASTP